MSRWIECSSGLLTPTPPQYSQLFHLASRSYCRQEYELHLKCNSVEFDPSNFEPNWMIHGESHHRPQYSSALLYSKIWLFYWNVLNLLYPIAKDLLSSHRSESVWTQSRDCTSGNNSNCMFDATTITTVKGLTIYLIKNDVFPTPESQSISIFSR